jgi:hypothetical protein
VHGPRGRGRDLFAADQQPMCLDLVGDRQVF